MGLFGNNRGIPRGLLEGLPQGVLAGGATYAPPTANAPTLAQQPAQPQRRRGHNWGGILADFAAGLAGQQGPYLAQLQRRQQAEDEAAQSQQERQARRDDWLFQQQWTRDNPAPRVNDTVEDYNFITQNLGDEWGQKYLRNRADPPRYVQGPDGQFYPVQTAEPQVLGPALPEGWQIEGGPGGSPSGAGFRP